MSELNLPEPIAAYFLADRKHGRDVARCFSKDGAVTDEKQIHVGHAAIEAWHNTTSSRFAYSVKLLTLNKQGRQFVVTGRVTGDFPGSPVDLRYIFALEQGSISALEITP